MIAAGLLGYAYTCPDLIGGGQFSSFLGIDQTKLDQELIVRSCQIHALMPMMQFSVAPWRILDKKHLTICRKYAHLHKEMGNYILEQTRQSAQTGEPIIRHMEYEYPHQGFINCKDQFMLGDKYLVAPILTKEHTRKVMLPKGQWKDDTGKKNSVDLKQLRWRLRWRGCLGLRRSSKLYPRNSSLTCFFQSRAISLFFQSITLNSLIEGRAIALCYFQADLRGMIGLWETYDFAIPHRLIAYIYHLPFIPLA